MKNYYMGLDMGTSSVGYATVDENYNILHYDDNPVYGVRLFNEAKTKEGRRMARTSRHRIQRQKERFDWLKSVFEPAIQEEDPEFFARLQNSGFFEEDKRGCTGPNILFNDRDYKDKDYRKDYPTTSHLRLALIEDRVPVDSRYTRLVFLALHQLFAHRGNFLNDWLPENQETVSFKEEFKKVWQNLNENINLGLPALKDETIEQLENILDSDENRTNKDKAFKAVLNKAANADLVEEGIKLDKEAKKLRDGTLAQVSLALTGRNFKPGTLFQMNDYNSEWLKKGTSFTNSNFDEGLGANENEFTDDQLYLLEVLKAIHDGQVLKRLLGDHQYLSEARVTSYQDHKWELNELKRLVRDYCPQEYDGFFREMQLNNYAHYVHHSKYYDKNSDSLKKTGRELGKKCDYSALLKKVADLLTKIPDSEASKQELLERISKNTLFNKQMGGFNGVIPYQVHLKELRKILDQASQHLSFLNDEDESCHLTNREKIEMVFSFRRPFYVGPVNTTAPNKVDVQCWAVRKEGGKVYPWNIEEKIDYPATRQAFIEHLIGNCTYLPEEKVMPRSSLDYERFVVLNQVNSIRHNNIRLDPDQKQRLFTEVVENKNQLSQTDVKKFLVQDGVYSKADIKNVEINGMDVKLTSGIHSLQKFKKLFGTEQLTSKQIQIAESIIHQLTIFGEDKKLISEWLDKEFPTELTPEQREMAKSFTFSGWGTLSKAFIHLAGMNKDTGKVLTLTEALWTTSQNLMEILASDQYTFKEELARRRTSLNKTLKDFAFNDLNDTYLSAPVKRMCWQTILVIKDVIKALGNPPERLFIEMPREIRKDKKGKGQRTESRRTQLMNLFKQKNAEYEELLKELETITDDQLRKDKYFLYFLQKGKDIYTGESIPLEAIVNNWKNDRGSVYDVDHIWARHWIKDNSILNNLVLTNKKYNESVKGDKYPVDAETRDKMTPFWQHLKKVGLMSSEKFNRLTRSEVFTEDELSGFINRQLVETGYATKTIAHLLEELLPETEVVYTKAGLVSDFRHEFHIPKVRELNDYHHAEDAYLNIVAGNAYYTKFTRNPANFIRSAKNNRLKEEYRYNLGKFYERPVEKAGKIAWKPGEKGTIQTVRNNLESNVPLISYMTYTSTGSLFEATIVSPKKKNKGSAQLKFSDSRYEKTDRYGSYRKMRYRGIVLVESGKPKRRQVSFEFLPGYLCEKMNTDTESIERFCRDILKLVNPRVIKTKILTGTLFEIEGKPFYITGKDTTSLSVRIASQLVLNPEQTDYLKIIINSNENGWLHHDITKEKNSALYRTLTEKYRLSKRPSVVSSLEKNFTKFSDLSILNQVKLLTALVNGFKGNGEIDLTLVGGSNKSFKEKPARKIKPKATLTMITTSPSGLFSKREIIWDGEQ